MNIEEIAKRIAELHYPNKPNAIIDESYREVRMETLRKQVESELKNCSIPAVVGQSEQLLAFAQYLHNHSYVNKGFKPETLVRRFKGE